MKDGAVVKGAETEFKECDVVAASLTEFAEKVIKSKLKI